MSTSLLKKSLKLFEEDKGKNKAGVHKALVKHRKNNNQVVRRHSSNEKNVKKRVEENIKKLQLLNNYKVSTSVCDKIVKHVNRDFIPLTEKPKEEERTAFTEEDFAAFERDYMPEN